MRKKSHFWVRNVQNPYPGLPARETAMQLAACASNFCASVSLVATIKCFVKLDSPVCSWYGFGNNFLCFFGLWTLFLVMQGKTFVLYTPCLAAACLNCLVFVCFIKLSRVPLFNFFFFFSVVESSLQPVAIFPPPPPPSFFFKGRLRMRGEEVVLKI